VAFGGLAVPLAVGLEVLDDTAFLGGTLERVGRWQKYLQQVEGWGQFGGIPVTWG